METVAGRTYKVKRNEFPLSITIAPKNTSGNRATMVVVGHIREIKGSQIDQRDANVTDAQGVITYDIGAPQSAGTVEMVQTLLGFFATAEKDNARFEITIATSRGEQVATSIRRPTFNPATASLKFSV